MSSGLRRLDPFRSLLAALDVIPGRWFVVATELAIYGAVPDMVVGSSMATPKWPSEKPLSFVEASVLADVMRRDHRSIEHIRKALFLTEAGATRTLDSLERSGFLSSDSGRYTAALDLSGVSLLAIEFKLKRWREALSQAKDYLTFADNSYVVVDAAQVTASASVITQFKAAGVGLILQTRDDQFRVAVQSCSRATISAEKIQAVQKLIHSARAKGLDRPF